MKRSDIVEALQSKLDKLGVPPHVKGIQKIPSRVELAVLINGRSHTFMCRSGITRMELDAVLRNLETAWLNQVPGGRQIDIEEVTGGELVPA